MAAVIETKKGGACEICFNEFTPTDRQLTHKGAGNHNGFHPECLEPWRNSKISYLFNKTRHTFPCPYDKMAIDSDSLSLAIDPKFRVSRIEQIKRKLPRLLMNVSLAAVLGKGAALLRTGTEIAGLLPPLAAGAAGVAVGVERIDIPMTLVTLGVLGVVAVGVSRLRVAGLKTATAVAIAGLKTVRAFLGGPSLITTIGIGASTAMGTAVGATGTSLFLNSLRINRANRENIYAGVLISLVLSASSEYDPLVPTALATNWLVAGVIAGGLTMLRR